MKTAPEAVSFPMSHLSGQGNSFSSARAASGFALTVSIVNQALWCRAQSFPFRLP
jgi:hypothetical protein